MRMQQNICIKCQDRASALLSGVSRKIFQLMKFCEETLLADLSRYTGVYKAPYSTVKQRD
jgi:hypothetical protein